MGHKLGKTPPPPPPAPKKNLEKGSLPETFFLSHGNRRNRRTLSKSCRNLKAPETNGKRKREVAEKGKPDKGLWKALKKLMYLCIKPE